MVKKLRIQQPKEAAAEPEADPAPEEKEARKRSKRPGKPRTSKDKREKKAAAKAKENGEEEEAKSEAEGEVKVDPKKAAQAAQEKRDQRRSRAMGNDGKEVKAEEEDKYIDNRVFVRGLPPGTDEKAVQKIFAGKGEIRSVKLVVNTRGEFRGCAFVTFSKEKDATAALALNGTEFKERELAVQKAAPPVKAPVLRVFLGGLPFNADVQTLRKDFGECGEITKFRMLLDNKTNKFNGSAFVTYKNQKGVDAALKYEGTEYGGRTLTCRLADPKGTLQGQKEAEDAAKAADGGKKNKGKAGAAQADAPAQGEAADGGKKGKKRGREEAQAQEKKEEAEEDAASEPQGKKKKGDKKKAGKA